MLKFSSTSADPAAAWKAMTDQQKVEWIAVNIMKWHVHKEYPEWWNAEDKYTGFAIQHYNQPWYRETFQPMDDWNHFRMVEEKVLGDDLLRPLLLHQFDSVTIYICCDLPTRCLALYLASQSPNENN